MRVIQVPSATEKVAFVFSNPLMKQVHKQAIDLASSSLPLFIRGERGVGKRTLARIIHQSSRPVGPFVSVDCGPLTEDLQVRELFGSGPGPDHGCLLSVPGKIQFATGGTLYLGGLERLSPALQESLIRRVRDKQSGISDRKEEDRFDCRLIACMEPDAERHAIGEDWYRKAGAVEIEIPPLRSRKDEIPLLCDYFLGRLAGRYEGLPASMPEPVMRRMASSDWTGGNLRELEEAVKSFLRDRLRIAAHQPSLPFVSEAESGGRWLEKLR